MWLHQLVTVTCMCVCVTDFGDAVPHTACVCVAHLSFIPLNTPAFSRALVPIRDKHIFHPFTTWRSAVSGGAPPPPPPSLSGDDVCATCAAKSTVDCGAYSAS